MGSLHWPEILLILFVLLLLFGVGRISKLGGELGSGLKAFKEGLSGKKIKDETQTDAEVVDEKTEPPKQD